MKSLLYLLVLVIAIVSCQKEDVAKDIVYPVLMEIPQGFPNIIQPKDNEYNQDRWLDAACALTSYSLKCYEMVLSLTFNQVVMGSSPVGRTIFQTLRPPLRPYFFGAPESRRSPSRAFADGFPTSPIAEMALRIPPWRFDGSGPDPKSA